jgi:TPR repeat protein
LLFTSFAADTSAMTKLALGVVLLAVVVSSNAVLAQGSTPEPQGQADLTRLQSAATGGDSKSMYRLAEKYWTGDGVARDHAQAATWYEKAALSGHDDAMTRMGILHENGRGVAQSYEKAAAWYRKAADLGNDSGMFSLAVLYWSGRGVTQNPVEAYKWLHLASTHASGGAATRNTAARDSLGRMMTPALIAEAQKRARDWQAAFDLHASKSAR